MCQNIVQRFGVIKVLGHQLGRSGGYPMLKFDFYSEDRAVGIFAGNFPALFLTAVRCHVVL